MKINRLKIQSFRAVGGLDLWLTAPITVLVGVNGVGKSTVLDALAILLSQLTRRLCGQTQRARPIAMDDIRNGGDFARLVISANINNSDIEWAVALNRKSGQYSLDRKSNFEELNSFISEFIENWDYTEVGRDEPFDLPLAVYYDVHRAVIDPPLRVREKLKNNYLDVYGDSLAHNGANFKHFFIWFRNREDLENEKRRDDPSYRDCALEAVRRAIQIFTDFSDLRVRRKPLRMTLQKLGTELNVAQLSDGEKCLLALVGDLARRLSILNPSKSDPLKGEGVVLIDEIDLHLHPSWQRKVITKLKETFPNCQFILSTHSPQILSHVKETSVFVLHNSDGEIYAMHPASTYGVDSSRILEDVMEVDERLPHVKHELEKIYIDIESSEYESAKKRIASLREKGANIPDMARAEALIKRKEMLSR